MRSSLIIASLLIVTIAGCHATHQPHHHVDADVDAHVHRHDTPPIGVPNHPSSPPPTVEGETIDVSTPPSKWLTPFPGVRARQSPREVRLTAEVCIEGGWLEQVACGVNSREHESLIVPRAIPSQIHAGLLMAGFENGTPGRWRWDDETLEFIEPTGDRVRVRLEFMDADGEDHEVPVGDWIIDADGGRFPDQPWVFGGSLIEANEEWMGPGEHYVADHSGSIIGLVTFGDEVLGLARVISDDATIQEPEWLANMAVIPPPGTEVEIVITPWDG